MTDIADFPYSCLSSLELDVDVTCVYPIDAEPTRRQRFRIIFTGDDSFGYRTESPMIFSRDQLRALKTALARFAL
jgi:hypothetical protein